MDDRLVRKLDKEIVIDQVHEGMGRD